MINPAYQKHLDFYTHDYLPHCARADGISAQPRGADYYALPGPRRTRPPT